MALKVVKLEKKSGKGDYFILPVELDYNIVPFDVVKTYFVLGGDVATKSGQHAHLKEEEFFIVLSGNVRLISLDQDGNEVFYEMTEGDGVYIPNKVWHGFDFLSERCVVIAYSSEHYNPDRSDYVEDKSLFITKYLNEK
ncbi:MAG: FdtA/QdtA family cupin domain-containing protein [Candidatus Gracilibacteria bacterium]|jgi:dTDP-4-dehydrorhamnose 3,5-epimerase-like enzyme|nr:FdtA/QdtA family cupin domain-containing protein [Candidatus Gracilibacteria bacterium]